MANKTIQARLQTKRGTSADWHAASIAEKPFVPLLGEPIFYTDLNMVKYGDGEHTPDALDFTVSTEETIVLENDLYTYTSIGKITGASNTNPVKVASKGNTLKTVFNSVFGVQQDTQPTITTSTVNLGVSAGTTSYGGGEYGTAVGATTVTVTFTLNNSGTANYGYRCGSTKSTGNQTFYYPVTKQSSGDIKITLPTGQTASSSMVTAGTYVSHSSNVLYCNFNSSKQVSIKISLPATTVDTSAKTRYGQISASVTLGAAQKENQLTAGTAITKFLTYLGNDATATAALSGGTKTNTAGSYTVSAGSKYVYWAKSSTTTTPTSWTRLGSGTTSITDMQLSCAANEYLWVATTSNKTNLYMFNDVSGKYNADPMATTKISSVTITNAQNASASGYYVYRTTNAMSLATNTKFKLA